METEKNKLLLLAVLILLTGAGTASTVTVDAVSATGSNLDDFDLSVTGDGISLSREGIDSFERQFLAGEYEFTLRKDGYSRTRRTVLVEEDTDASYTFSMAEEGSDENSSIAITRINSPERVCKGESFSVDFDIRNSGEKDQVISTTGYGFGKIMMGKSFVISSGQTRTYRFIFTGVRGSGTREFRVSASGLDSDSVTGEVNVDNCVSPGSSLSVENIETNVYPVEGRQKAFKGEVVRVKGFADGTRGNVDLNLSINGEKKGTIQTGRDGYFQTYFRPETAGKKTVTVSTSQVSGSTELRVVPDPEVSAIESPEEVFSGEQFEVCADVSASITPEVTLSENGDVIESRQVKGNVCFNIQAPEAGEYNYSIEVLTYGRNSASSKEVKVLEQGPEAGSFPGQVTSVETEDSLVKVELYNTNNGSRNYTVTLEGLSQDWVSEPVKNVSLSRGEEKTVYFYISPGSKGEFDATIRVESMAEVIYEDTVNVFSTGTAPPDSQSIDLMKVIVLTLNVVL